MRQTLLRAAKIIAGTKMHPAPLSGDQTVEFATVVDAGLVEIADDQIAFATPELLATWIARYCALGIADVWQDLAQTAQTLRQADHLFRALKLPRSATIQLFLSLENDCGKDVLARLAEAARVEVGAQEANIPLNAIYFAFCDALPELDYQATDLADYLGPVLNATESYLFAGKLHGAIERLAEQSQGKAEALIEAFVKHPERRSAELAANALKSLWTFDPCAAHKKALELTEAKLPALQRIGAIALASFSYELPSHEGELSATIDRLEELCESDDADLLSASARAFGALFAAASDDDNRLRRIREGFLRLASHEDPVVQSVVARVLVQRTDDSGVAEWFWDALGRLSGVPAHHRGVLRSLDLATYSMVERYTKRVTGHLEHVVTSRQYGMEGGPFNNEVQHLIWMTAR